MKTAIRKTVSLLLIFLLALTFLPARPAQAAEENASIPSDLLLAALDATSRPPAAGIQTGGLNFTFEAGGLQAAGFNWGVSLSGFGRGNQVRELSAAETVQTERQTEYRRPELTEWRRATAFGLQQGFTIQSAPSGKGALTLRLSLSTDLTGTLDADKRGLSFPIEDGRTLRYDHLLAWDANGAALDAQLVYMPGEIRIVVRDAGAAYPLTIDPLIYLEQKVIASDGAAGDEFGYSVALNAAGDTAIVGAIYDDVGANINQGSAYVFTRNGGVWSQQAQLTASDGAAYDYFGASVALNAAGDTAIVGAYGDDVGANADQGSAYVFTRNGGVWSQQAQLTASDGATYDNFGASVALNAAGDTAIVGADYDNVGANFDQGSAYVFARSGGVWSQQAQLTASDGAVSDIFGYSVALNAAGDTAIVGAYLDDVGANTNQGSAYFYQAYRTDNDLAVSATRGSSAPLHANDAVLLTASVMNYGPAAASSVGLNVPLPAGLTYASHTATRGSYDPVSGSWNVGNLPAYVSATLTIAVTVSNPAPKVTIYFTSSLVGRDTNDANNSSKLALPPAKTVIYRSNGAQDGWVLESGENTNKGGTLDAKATTFRLGDDAARKQYRAILSFNTSGLPDNAVITKVTLKVKRQGVTGGGNPVNTFQGFLADVKKGAFGTSALQITDYQTAANKTVGPDGPTPISEWYTLDLTGAGNFVNKLASNGGLTQIRLRFNLDDNNNAAANYLSLFSGNAPLASRPQLIVEYYIP